MERASPGAVVAGEGNVGGEVGAGERGGWGVLEGEEGTQNREGKLEDELEWRWRDRGRLMTAGGKAASLMMA